MTAFGIRAAFLDFIEDPWRHVGRESEAARFHADGLLVVEDGRIADFGAHDEVAARHAGLARHDHQRPATGPPLVPASASF